MGWWSAGGKADEVLGDDSADAVASMLAELGEPSAQELLDALAKALRANPEYAFGNLSMRLSDGQVLQSQANGAADAKRVKALRRGLDAVTGIYREAYHRPPTLREVLQNFLFILGYKPERFLSGVDGITVKAIDAESGEGT